MKIGFTERGDAGLDLRWFERCRDCDGLIAITKNLTPGCVGRLLELHHSGYPVILHAGVTGMPKSVERCTPDALDSLERLLTLIGDGFPKDRIVLRIDPIVPVGKGLSYPVHVLDMAEAMGLLPGLRVRVSVLDNYPHVKERFRLAFGDRGVLYGGAWNPPRQAFDDLTRVLRPYVERGSVSRFETCAETALTDASVYEAVGCLSARDLEIMGLDASAAPRTVNGQDRGGCLCLTCKKELLDARHPCANKCLYCYWRD